MVRTSVYLIECVSIVILFLMITNVTNVGFSFR